MRLLQVSEVHGGVAGSGWTGSSSPESSKGSVMGGLYDLVFCDGGLCGLVFCCCIVLGTIS